MARRPNRAGSVPCSVSGCETESKSKGLCNPHYMTKWRHGDPAASVRRQTRAPIEGPCQGDRDCPNEVSRVVVVDGEPLIVCNACRLYFQRHSTFVRARPKLDGSGCLVESCDRTYWARGFCRTHSKNLYPDYRRQMPAADAVEARKTFLGNRCYLCGATDVVAAGHSFSRSTHPHLAAFAANIRPQCPPCNSRQGTVPADPHIPNLRTAPLP